VLPRPKGKGDGGGRVERGRCRRCRRAPSGRSYAEIPWCRASRTMSTRPFAPSLASMCEMWVCTVRRDKNMPRAMSDVESPLATRPAILSSVGVSASQPEAGRGPRRPRTPRLMPWARSRLSARRMSQRASRFSYRLAASFRAALASSTRPRCALREEPPGDPGKRCGLAGMAVRQVVVLRGPGWPGSRAVCRPAGVGSGRRAGLPGLRRGVAHRRHERYESAGIGRAS